MQCAHVPATAGQIWKGPTRAGVGGGGMCLADVPPDIYSVAGGVDVRRSGGDRQCAEGDAWRGNCEFSRGIPGND